MDEKKAKEKLKRLLFKGALNSVLLALFFVMCTYQWVHGDSYFLVLLGVLSVFSSGYDAMEFYHVMKAVEEGPKNG